MSNGGKREGSGPPHIERGLQQFTRNRDLLMKTAREIHADLVSSGMTSTQAVEHIAGIMDRSIPTVWGWIGKRPPPKHSLGILNMRVKS